MPISKSNKKNVQRIWLFVIIIIAVFTACFGIGKIIKRNIYLEANNSEMTESIYVLQADKELLEYRVSVLTESVQEISEQNNQLNMELEELKAKNTKRMVYLGEFKVTYYCIENYPHICGTENRQTASGKLATPGVTIAADPSIIPMGSEIYIAGIGVRTVQDTGGAIKGNRIDVCVATHAEALRLGVKTLQVWRLL